MSWYKQLKAMPLPKAEYPEDFPINDFVLNGTFSEEIDLGEGAKYLDRGSKGMVYDLGNDTVAKLSVYRQEYEVAKKVLELQEQRGGFLSCVVGIHEAVQLDRQPSFKIVAEKVNILSEEEKRRLSEVQDVLADLYKKYGNLKNMKLLIKQTLKKNRETHLQDCAMKYMNMLGCLLNNELPTTDLHPRNIGVRKDGSFVLLDLGFHPFDHK